jgi:hypothetical protein
MRRNTMLLVAFLIPSCIHAQQDTTAEPSGLPWEIGTMLGVSFFEDDAASPSQSTTQIGMPGGYGVFGAPTVYATLFVAPSVFLEPQLSLAWVSAGGSKETTAGLGADVGYLVEPKANGSAFIAGNAAFESTNTGGAHKQGGGLGLEVGYRARVATAFALRVGALYRRWYGDFKQVNELGIGVGFGAVIR